MVFAPPCIAFVNSDIDQPSLIYIKRQLYIDEVISQETFNTRVASASDGYYNGNPVDPDGYFISQYIIWSDGYSDGYTGVYEPPLYYPDYPSAVKLSNKRVLVLIDMSDYTNRNLADIVFFVKHAMISTEHSKYRPPRPMLKVENVNYKYFGITSAPFTVVYDTD